MYGQKKKRSKRNSLRVGPTTTKERKTKEKVRSSERPVEKTNRKVTFQNQWRLCWKVYYTARECVS